MLSPNRPEFKVGDLVGVVVHGLDVFGRPVRIRNICEHDDGSLWAFVEGSEAAVPLASLTLATEQTSPPPVDPWDSGVRASGVPIAEGSNGCPLDDVTAKDFAADDNIAEEFETAVDAPLCPNKADIAAHLYALFAPAFVKDFPEAWFEVAYGRAATGGAANEAKLFSVFHLKEAADFAEEKNKGGFNIYVGPAMRQGEKPKSGRAKDAAVVTSAYAWSEFDKPGDGARIDLILKEKNLRRAIIIVTGRTPHLRAHLYFKLTGSVTLDELRTANTALKALFGSDDVASPAHLMRLAGTVNYPTPKKRERGYVPELVTLHNREDAPAYTVEHLIGLAGNEAKPSSGVFGFDAKAGRTDDEIVELLKCSCVKGEWHNAIRNAIASMIGRGWDDIQIKLACALYCKGGADDPDLVPLIEGARKKWDKPDEDAVAGSLDDAEIERLARLPLLEYDRQRITAAEALGVRAPILDKLVSTARVKLGLIDQDDDDKQGRAVSFPEPEPWPEAVNGAELLDAVATVIRRHVVLSDTARDAAALWVLHTYLVEVFSISPRLGVLSPTKRCGKTTLLDVLGCLVLRSLPTANVSPAAVFRVIEMYHPTLLVDEADTFIRDSDELRGVLNSGHRKGGQVLRTVGEDHEPRAFSTYGACAVALIGTLPDTLHDRSVAIELKRRLKSEYVEPFRIDRTGHLDVLARKAARWAKGHAGRIGALDPKMPESIINREADNWRPLLAIAEAAGGDWPECARKAAEAAHAAGGEGEAAPIEVLVGDIKGIFAGKDVSPENSEDKITSADLVEALVGIEGHPWAEMGRARKPLTANRLAKMLRSLGIGPDTIRVGDKTPKGYFAHRFKDAFARFCPEGVSEPQHRHKADEIRTSEPFQTATEDWNVAVVKCAKSNNDGQGCGVAVVRGVFGENAHVPPLEELPGLDEGDDLEPGENRRPRLIGGFQVMGAELPGSPCSHCGSRDGVVYLIRNPLQGVRSTPLHEHCAVAWFDQASGSCEDPPRDEAPGAAARSGKSSAADPGPAAKSPGWRMKL